ncbi:MAG: hypothetical protein JXK92_02750, partial [Erysipelotrichaceae bacterium]|nr:hypothetical protein [Erysipelotrichaceae bacterium]
MKYSYLENRELNEAVRTYIEHLNRECRPLGVETIEVIHANQRITARAVKAKRNAPHYYAAAMDGIATVAAKTYQASETTPIRLVLNEDYMVVDTGDPIDPKFDTVIMVEDLIQTEDDEVVIMTAVAPYSNIRQIGEDVCEEEILVPSNTLIRPSVMGALLAGGVTSVEVYRKILVGLIPTGDEVVPFTIEPKPGDVLEFNSTIFKGMLEEWGCEANAYPIVPDQIDLLESALKRAVEECD